MGWVFHLLVQFLMWENTWASDRLWECSLEEWSSTCAEGLVGTASSCCRTWGTSLLLEKCAMHFSFFPPFHDFQWSIYLFQREWKSSYSTCSIHQGYESPFLDSNSQLLAFTYGIKNESSASGEIQILHFCSVSSVTRQQLRVLLQTFLIGMQPLDYPCSLWMIYCHPLRQCYLLFCPSEVQTLCSLLCCAI